MLFKGEMDSEPAARERGSPASGFEIGNIDFVEVLLVGVYS